MTNTNQLKAETILAAATLGTIAFKEGRKAIPVHDPELMKLMSENQGYYIPLMKAWTESWHAANMA